MADDDTKTNWVLTLVVWILVAGELVVEPPPQKLILFAAACALSVYVLPRMLRVVLADWRARRRP